MKSVKSLDREALVDIVENLQSWLYLGDTGAEDGETIIEAWNPDNEWSPADICEGMAGKLSEYKLVPEFLGDEPEEPVSKCEICGGPPH